jgi:Phosphatidylinositol-glycan biosynthesis class S protein
MSRSVVYDPVSHVKPNSQNVSAPSHIDKYNEMSWSAEILLFMKRINGALLILSNLQRYIDDHTQTTDKGTKLRRIPKEQGKENDQSEEDIDPAAIVLRMPLDQYLALLAPLVVPLLLPLLMTLLREIKRYREFLKKNREQQINEGIQSINLVTS